MSLYREQRSTMASMSISHIAESAASCCRTRAIKGRALGKGRRNRVLRMTGSGMRVTTGLSALQLRRERERRAAQLDSDRSRPGR